MRPQEAGRGEEQIVPQRLPGGTAPPILRFWTSGLENWERITSCRSKPSLWSFVMTAQGKHMYLLLPFPLQCRHGPNILQTAATGSGVLGVSGSPQRGSCFVHNASPGWGSLSSLSAHSAPSRPVFPALLWPLRSGSAAPSSQVQQASPSHQTLNLSYSCLSVNSTFRAPRFALVSTGKFWEQRNELCSYGKWF